MSDQSSLPKALTKNATGLGLYVRARLKDVLSELVPLWNAEPKVDWKRVVRPTGNGAYSISIEPYRGVHAWINFRNAHQGTDLLSELEDVVRREQPELLGYVVHSGGMMLIQDVFALISSLCQAVLRHSEVVEEVGLTIDRVLADLDSVLSSGSASEEVITVLNGLRLPVEIDVVNLDSGLSIRRLTDSELSEFASNDISLDNPYGITSKQVSVALVSTRQVTLTLSQVPADFTPDFSGLQVQQDQIAAVLSALHLLKAGRVGIVASFKTLHPTILPNMSGSSSAPLLVNPFASMELSVNDVERFLTIYKGLVKNERDEVKIAAARLLDAETRLSPVDSLLDAVIGLEVMLNPNDRDELAFRVALNYAFLGSDLERRARFESIREIQKVRNRVVHGGLNLQSKDAALIHQCSEKGKSCLRDTIIRFLDDDKLSGNEKLNAEFWLDRVIPPDLN